MLYQNFSLESALSVTVQVERVHEKGFRDSCYKLEVLKGLVREGFYT
jgi:hypothetical protein